MCVRGVWVVCVCERGVVHRFLRYDPQIGGMPLITTVDCQYQGLPSVWGVYGGGDGVGGVGVVVYGVCVRGVVHRFLRYDPDIGGMPLLTTVDCQSPMCWVCVWGGGGGV